MLGIQRTSEEERRDKVKLVACIKKVLEHIDAFDTNDDDVEEVAKMIETFTGNRRPPTLMEWTLSQCDRVAEAMSDVPYEAISSRVLGSRFLLFSCSSMKDDDSDTDDVKKT